MIYTAKALFRKYIKCIYEKINQFKVNNLSFYHSTVRETKAI